MDQKIEKIHASALRILAEVGIRLKHPSVLDMLRHAGMRVDGERAFFSGSQIEEWLASAPASFKLHARNAEHDITLGGDRTELAPGYGCPTIISTDGSRRGALLEDYLLLAALVHQQDLFAVNGGILAQPNDVDAGSSHLVMLYAAARMSDKCLWGVPGLEAHIRQTMEAASILCGGANAFRSKPSLLTMISTISPLQVDRMALDSILVCAEYGQPLVISPGPAAGTTGPIDLGANIALATAEALACIVVAQVARQGTPVLFGLQCYGSDLKSGNISIGSPAYALQASYCAGLARRYRLPSRAGGAVTDAKALTAQAGYESMLSTLAGLQSGIHLMVHSAGILDSFAGISYEKFMVDAEIIRMARYYLDDAVEAPNEGALLNLIGEVGETGQFLTTMDTMRKCRTHSWNPQVSVRGYAKANDPRQQLLENIEKSLQRSLQNYLPPQQDESVWRDLDAYLLCRVGMAGEVLQKVRSAGNSVASLMPTALKGRAHAGR